MRATAPEQGLGPRAPSAGMMLTNHKMARQCGHPLPLLDSRGQVFVGTIEGCRGECRIWRESNFLSMANLPFARAISELPLPAEYPPSGESNRGENSGHSPSPRVATRSVSFGGVRGQRQRRRDRRREWRRHQDGLQRHRPAQQRERSEPRQLGLGLQRPGRGAESDRCPQQRHQHGLRRARPTDSKRDHANDDHGHSELSPSH